MAKSTFIYVTYIRTTPEKLWSALTVDTEFMKQYWFGVHCESQWTAGSPWKMLSPEGKIFDAGEIIEAVAPRRLVIRDARWNSNQLEQRSSFLSPTPSSAIRPSLLRRCLEAGRRSFPT